MEAETSLLNLMQLVEQEQPPGAPLTNNDDTLDETAEQDTDENNAPLITSTFSPRYSQFLTAELRAAISQPKTPPVDQNQVLDGDPMSTSLRQISTERIEEVPAGSGLNISITHNERTYWTAYHNLFWLGRGMNLIRSFQYPWLQPSCSNFQPKP